MLAFLEIVTRGHLWTNSKHISAFSVGILRHKYSELCHIHMKTKALLKQGKFLLKLI